MFRLAALVRDGATGLPKFDDPENAPDEVKALIRKDEIARMDPTLVKKLKLDNQSEIARLGIK